MRLRIKIKIKMRIKEKKRNKGRSDEGNEKDGGVLIDEKSSAERFSCVKLETRTC